MTRKFFLQNYGKKRMLFATRKSLNIGPSYRKKKSPASCDDVNLFDSLLISLSKYESFRSKYSHGFLFEIMVTVIIMKI